jgi:hypothetical protein
VLIPSALVCFELQQKLMIFKCRSLKTEIKPFEVKLKRNKMRKRKPDRKDHSGILKSNKTASLFL